MSFVILIDGRVVETAETEEQARQKAEWVQQNAGRYVHDEFGGAFAVVGFAPMHDHKNISHLKPRCTVPEALVPKEFKQLK